MKAISLSLGTPNVNIMKTPEYTHIRVPKELHAILKKEAEARGMSIANYINEVLASIQSIRVLVSSKSDVNISTNTSEDLPEDVKKESTNSPERIRTSVTGSKGQYA
jgi:hypothetical protein